MELQFIEEEIFYNVGIGQIFRCDGAYWVCLPFDYTEEKYPSICIKVAGNPYYDKGDIEYFAENEKIEIYRLTKIK